MRCYGVILVAFILQAMVFCFDAKAQVSSLDSLKSLLNDKQGIERLDVLNQIALILTDINQKDAKIYATDAVNLAETLNYPLGRAEANRLLGFLSNVPTNSGNSVDNYKRSLGYLTKALSIFEMAEYAEGRALTMNNLGKLYYDHSQYDKAYEQYIEAAKFWEELGNRNQLATTFNDLGNVYFQQGIYTQALDYYRKAYDIQRIKSDDNSKARTLNNIASALCELDELEESLDIHFQALELKLGQNNVIGAAISYNNIGDVYEKQGDFQMAIDYQKKSLVLANQLGNLINRIYTYNRLARVQLKNNQIDESENSLMAGFLLVENTGYDKLKIDTYDLFYQLYKKKGDPGASLRYFEKYNQLKDSVFSQQRANQITNLRIDYETERRNVENRLLREKEGILKARVRDQFIINIITGLALVLALVLIGTLVRTNKIRNRTNLELSNTISELKRTQSQLIHSEKMASLGQLTAGVAHEINNPMNFISTGIMALEKNITNFIRINEEYSKLKSDNGLKEDLSKIDELKKQLRYDESVDDISKISESIREGVARTSSIVKSLNLFSRKDKSEIREEDLHEELDASIVVLGGRLRGQIEIRKNYDPKLECIDCCPEQISHVFLNILNNAIDAIGDKKGTIWVKTKKYKDKVKINIKDDGPGIPEDVLGKVFEPFFTTKEVGQGSGLGLSISYGIIQRHGGIIEVKSKPGKGTEFIISLPAS